MRRLFRSFLIQDSEKKNCISIFFNCSSEFFKLCRKANSSQLLVENILVAKHFTAEAITALFNKSGLASGIEGRYLAATFAFLG